MLDQPTALELVERAERDEPSCPTCGRPNVAVAHADGAVWFECISLGEDKSILRRILTLDLAPIHTRQLIVAA